MRKITIISPALTQQLKALRHRFIKNHYFVVSTLLLIGLSIAVYLAGETLNLPTDDQYRDQKTSASTTAKFDQATIDKIEHLQRSDQQPAPFALPSGARSNPFAE